MKDLKKHIENLGKLGTDKLNKFEGIIGIVTFDLFGAIQYGMVADNDRRQMPPLDCSRIKVGKVIRKVDINEELILKGVKGLGKKTTVEGADKKEGRLIEVRVDESGGVEGDVEYLEDGETFSNRHPIAALVFKGKAVITPPDYWKDSPIAKGGTGPIKGMKTDIF